LTPLVTHDFPSVAATSSYTASPQHLRRLSDDNTLPAITSQYPLSKVAFFDLHSFDWACRLPKPTTIDMVSCSLEIRGYSNLGKISPSAAKTRDVALFKYTVAAKEQKPVVMQRVVTQWTVFNGLHTVTFEILPAGSILFLDNLSILTYNVTDWKDGIGTLIHEAGRNGW